MLRPAPILALSVCVVTSLTRVWRDGWTYTVLTQAMEMEPNAHGKFTQKGRPLLCVDTPKPIPVGIMLRPTAMRDSVKDNTFWNLLV
jgi:hypothetical protein